MEGALIEVPTIRRLTGIERIGNRVPDQTTNLTFLNLLEKQKLGEKILDTVKVHLSARGIKMREGTIIDAT